MHPILKLRWLLCAVVIVLTWALPVAAAPEAATRARLSEVYGELPLSFEAKESPQNKVYFSRGTRV